MSNLKMERVVTLVTRLEAARLSVIQIEAELEGILRTQPKKSPQSNGVSNGAKKPTRNKIRILRIVKKAGGPMQFRDITGKGGMSQAGTLSILNELIKSGEVTRPGFGKYLAK